jgi:hypothetical protein
MNEARECQRCKILAEDWEREVRMIAGSALAGSPTPRPPLRVLPGHMTLHHDRERDKP